MFRHEATVFLKIALTYCTTASQMCFLSHSTSLTGSVRPLCLVDRLPHMGGKSNYEVAAVEARRKMIIIEAKLANIQIFVRLADICI